MLFFLNNFHHFLTLFNSIYFFIFSEYFLKEELNWR
jgi:hypothetical protein